MSLDEEAAKKMREHMKWADSFPEGWEPTTVFQDSARRLQDERNRLIIDPYQLRINQDWSELNNQVVGVEYPN